MKLPINPGIFDAQQAAKWRNSFLVNARIKLNYVRDKEPAGWPLTRPASAVEWSHVLRVMIMRRVPESGPIHRARLIKYVTDDLASASDAGRLYVDQYFSQMRAVLGEVNRLIESTGILKSAPYMVDPEIPYPDVAIYRTERAVDWLGRVPRVIQAVVDYLPTTSVLDMVVQALIDAPESESDTP